MHINVLASLILQIIFMELAPSKEKQIIPAMVHPCRIQVLVDGASSEQVDLANSSGSLGLYMCSHCLAASAGTAHRRDEQYYYKEQTQQIGVR